MSDNTEYTPGAGPALERDPGDKRPCLVMINGDFIGQVFELKDDVTMIGRSDEVDLTVSDTSLSRRHAMVVNRAGGLFVSDLGSTNGSFLNSEVISDPVVLNEGDKITLGNIVFKFTYQDEHDAEYHSMLRNMAVRDGLTRLYNKQYFSETLQNECEYNRRNHIGLSLIIFDIDHFKQINDTWGHPAGDFILKNLASLIDNEAREYDVFARYGGEEFAFLLRGGSLEGAITFAERVRHEIEDHAFVYDELDLKITVSLGVSHWNGDTPMQADELVEAADRRLYEAKEGGRNCVKHDTLIEGEELSGS